jgi:hypothetical protein
MQCADVLQFIDEFAIDQADHPLEEALREHLESCATCRQTWLESCDAWAAIPTTLEPASDIDFASLEDRIVSVAQRENVDSAVSTSNVKPEALDRISFLRYPLAAVVLLVMLAASYYFLFRPDPEQVAERVLIEKKIRDLAASMDKMQWIEQEYGNPTVHYVSLLATAERPQAGAYLLHDVHSNEGHLFVFGLEPLANGGWYTVWLLGKDDQVMASRSFQPDARGRAAVVIPFPARVTPPRETLLTQEGSAQAEAPSEQIILRASLAHMDTLLPYGATDTK